MQYRVIRDVRFHDNEKREDFFIKKGSVYTEVTTNNQSHEIKNCVKICKKTSTNSNSQFVVLDTDGFHRVFEVHTDVVPHQKRRIRRIQRWKS